MSLILNDEQIMLQDAARNFFSDKAPVAALRSLRDAGGDDCFSRELWAEMAAMGFAGVLVSEEYGGADFGLMGAALIAMEMGRTLVASPMLSTAIVGATLIGGGASDDVKSLLLPKLSSGELITALAFEESARFDLSRISTTATAQDVGWRITGEKMLVLDGYAADILIVAARCDAELCLFAVDANADGVGKRREVLIDSRGAATITFDNVRVDAGNAIDGGLELLTHALDVANICLAAEMAGLSENVFGQTVQYLKERKQFGVPVGSFQALQHRAADLFGELELSRSTALGAVATAQRSVADLSRAASLAKAKCSEVAQLATNEAVQMHGGMGMTDEFDLGFFMKRARAAKQTFGDPAWHLDRYAKLKGF